MERQVRLTLLYLTLLSQHGETPAPLFDWPGVITQTISRLPAVREKVGRVVEFRRRLSNEFLLGLNPMFVPIDHPDLGLKGFTRSLRLAESIFIFDVFQGNASWGKTLGEVGYKICTSSNGSLSIYSSDIDSLKELMSTIFKEYEVQDIPQSWIVGYEEIMINKTPKDPTKPMAKFVGLLRKSLNVTVAEFHEDWERFAPTFSSWPLVQEKVVVYAQFHSSPEWTEEFAEIGLNMATYDGVVDVYFDDFEDMSTCFNTKYRQEMIPLEAAFIYKGPGGGLMLGLDKEVGKENLSSS